MFTANSMNCLTEALGLSLPGNGSTLATHAARRALFERAGRTVVELCRRWYDEDDESALPRSIAAAGGVRERDGAGHGDGRLDQHGAAHPRRRPGGRDRLHLADIDEIGRRVPCLSKVAPNSDYHMEDVHRAGGIPAILGELYRGGLLNDGRALRALARRSSRGWTSGTSAPRRRPRRRSSCSTRRRAGSAPRKAFSTANRWSSLDTDAAGGCIRDVEHAYTKDGGLAVLRGNLAENGAVIKAAGIDEELWHFEGPARVLESQEEAVSAILNKEIQPGEVLVVRYEGPAGGPGMQEMLHPTAFLKGSGPRQEVRADHRRPLLRRLVAASRSATSPRRRRPAA